MHPTEGGHLHRVTIFDNTQLSELTPPFYAGIQCSSHCGGIKIYDKI